MVRRRVRQLICVDRIKMATVKRVRLITHSQVHGT